jgi:flagellar biosynthesis protein
MPDEKPKNLKAVALKFQMGKDEAPQVLAKGQGLMAEKLLAIAKEQGIPLYEDPELVEVLSKLDMGGAIAPELYQAVAEVLLFIYRTNKAKMMEAQKANQQFAQVSQVLGQGGKSMQQMNVSFK